jgi:hypothetical protein
MKKMESPMQGIIAGMIFAAFLLSPAIASAKQEGPPHYDIPRTCQGAQIYAINDKDLAYRGCVSDENEARAQLERKWRQYKPQSRKDCIEEGATPVPSYVELLTCLEMNEEAATLDKPGGSRPEGPHGTAVPDSPNAGQAMPSSIAPAPPETGAMPHGTAVQDSPNPGQAMPSSVAPAPPEAGAAKKPD